MCLDSIHFKEPVDKADDSFANGMIESETLLHYQQRGFLGVMDQSHVTGVIRKAPAIPR